MSFISLKNTGQNDEVLDEATEALAITANTGVSIWLCQMVHTLKIFILCPSDTVSEINEAGRDLNR